MNSLSSPLLEVVDLKNKEKPYIDKSTCVGCSLCVVNCPADCLEIEDPEFHGDIETKAYLKEPEKCISCKICAKACPIDAIRFSDSTIQHQKGGIKMSLYKAFCRIYQGVFKIGMYMIPWGMPKTLEGPHCITKLPEWIKEKGYDNVLVVTDHMLSEMGMLEILLMGVDLSQL